MTIYIALLRGINVGGHNKVKMAELKQMFENLGLQQVQTYIQSGNVLFLSEENTETLHHRVEQEILNVFGFSVAVILRTADELKQIVENCPFSEEAIAKAAASFEGESLYVALLPESPSKDAVHQLHEHNNDYESCQVEGRNIYLLLGQGIRHSKLMNQLQKLNAPSTVRNWKTMNKLVTLAVALLRTTG